MMTPNIFKWIKSEESKYETEQVPLGDNWNWNMRDHIQLIHHLKHGIFYQGENNWMRAFKKVMKPIIDLANWTEDIEVKDIVFYIKGQKGKVMSFLLKKYHDEIYAKKHNIDNMIDGITETDNSFGGTIVQKAKDCPEVLPLQQIAFCNQSDLKGSPIAFKHFFSLGKLRAMKKYGWGDPANGATISVDELAAMAESSIEVTDDRDYDTTGKMVEVYVVRGEMPNHFLYDNDDMEGYSNQIQIVAFYTDKEKNKQGVILYRKKDTESLKTFSAQPIPNKALGESVGEDMLHPQIWTNFYTIHKTKLLEAASKVVLYTDDSSYKTKNKIQDMENLELTTIADNKRIFRVPTAATANIQLIQNAVSEWFESAQFQGAAFDPILGKEAVSGTTFRGQERTVAQGRGSHDRKRGKRAKFIEEIYRDWIIPDMVKEITGGKEFLASLSVDELNWIADVLSVNQANARIKEKIMNMEEIDPEEQKALKEVLRSTIVNTGNKQMLEILKDEFKGIEIEIGINVANKQKDLALLSDKILSIFQFVFSNPVAFQQAMQVPALSKAFGDILEFSGMSMGDFSTLLQAPESPLQVEAPGAVSPEMVLTPQENE